MIPIHLRISGFLSYRETAELDFGKFDLACISGHNGAGKSSLLDAITWALFGEARGKSSDVINLYPDVKAAEVTFIFKHEGNLYRVQRTLPRNKSTILEFQILEGGNEGDVSSTLKGQWRPLTEKTTRETQKRIEQILRLDYETFVNASFFLQGKADQFTQQNPSKRKEVLSNILGLEAWEVYKARAAEKRKALEREVDEIDGRMAEIEAELSEETTRKARLAELEASLKQLTSLRAAQESALENIKRNAALLDEQRKMMITLSANLERARTALAELEGRLAAKETERIAYADLFRRADEIESAYKAWQDSRKQLEKWDEIASQFHEHERERTPLLERIAAEKAKLEQELSGLQEQEKAILEQTSEMEVLQREIEATQRRLTEVEEKIKEREELTARLQSLRERQTTLKTENEALKAEMNQLKERIEALKSAAGAECPLCGQRLTPEHRKFTLDKLEKEGREKGDRFRANKNEMEDLRIQIADLEVQIAQLASAENERVQLASEVSQRSERLNTLQVLRKEWGTSGEKRLKQVQKLLEEGKYALEEQKQLAKLNKELAKLGYDASAYDAARQAELRLRSVEDEYQNLKSAQEVIRQIEDEITNLKEEQRKRKEEIEEYQKQYEATAAALAEAEAQLPDLDAAERQVFALREEENKLRSELGAAQQRVEILAVQRKRKAEFESAREELLHQIARYKTLERAFGKDGVPALLIEQALPQIEARANELLDRLSDGQMSIRFTTQAEYKDKKREDLKETLDIQISDSAGTRAYEMYSGGEAFRVNFAIRLALSEILAQRKGARLQTLVIDEGFGSQDVQGRQRLIEAINIVKDDFAKILVITHLDELKDAFPARIEVEKTERGSIVRLI